MKRILLCGADVPRKITDIFVSLNYDVMNIPESGQLSSPVALHPDMLFSVIGERRLLTDIGYYEENRSFFEGLKTKDVEIVLSEGRLSEKYPSDVLFDAIRTEELLVGNLKYTAPELFSDNIKAVNVKQGYALCSTLLMDGAAITADEGIYTALRDNGYDVLRISPGGIVLNGYGHGFIGGASAVLEREKTVFFFGNVYVHPDGERIACFCEENGYKVYCDENTPLTDLGGIKVI